MRNTRSEESVSVEKHQIIDQKRIRTSDVRRLVRLYGIYLKYILWDSSRCTRDRDKWLPKGRAGQGVWLVFSTDVCGQY